MSKQTKQFFQEQNTGDSRILLKNFGTNLLTIQWPPVYLLLGKQKPKSNASAEPVYDSAPLRQPVLPPEFSTWGILVG